MLDQFQRNIHYLRISVTDRCNLRCVYCMPESGVECLPHSAILTYEQIARLVEQFAALGVTHIRLTGGEPLVRPQLYKLVAAIRAVPGIERITLTTNGVLLAQQLPQLLEAGIDGVNISLDTLDRQQFAAITRRDLLLETLSGLEVALGVPGLTVKVNCVPSETNRDQLVPLAALARDRDLSVRFIEMMPIGLGRNLGRLTQEEVLAQLTDAFGAPLDCPPPLGAGPSTYRTFPGFTGRVGFISAVSHQFCHNCNRVRLTATGYLKTCLQYETGRDLKALLDGGASDDELRRVISETIRQKPASHHFSTAAQSGDEAMNMHQIGG